MLPSEGLFANFGGSVPELFDGAIAIRGIAGDSRRHHRPGLFLARHDQVDLRHGCFALLKHRRHAGQVEQTSC